MAGWADGPMAAYDCESTGVDVETARIVTACVARVGGGTPAALIHYLADPGVEISAEATAIHGITTEHAREHGGEAASIVAAIESHLAAAWTGGLPVVGFNIAYDLTVLDRELRRHHGRGLTVAGPVIDPLVIDRRFDRYRRGSRKLDAMCAHYGVTQDGPHTAEGDAVAAARLAWKQARTYPGLASMSLTDLTAAQASWYAEWACQFREYLAIKGRTDDLPDGAWPVRHWPQKYVYEWEPVPNDPSYQPPIPAPEWTL